MALSYCWERMPVAPHPLAAGATSHSSSAPSSSSATQPHSTAAAASLHAVNAEGELLPGEVATTTITFRPLVAGAPGSVVLRSLGATWATPYRTRLLT